MHFPQSTSIRETILKAGSILLQVHRNPDLDSVGSALAMQTVLTGLGKKSAIVGPHPLHPDYLFLPGASGIRTVDYRSFDCTPYDLFIILDSGSPQIVTGDPAVLLPGLTRIVIDHHMPNSIDASLKLIDERASATAEILYHLFRDWDIRITPPLATLLFAGLSHDTLFFRATENDSDTFRVAAALIDAGADKASILTNVYNSLSLPFMNSIGKMLERIKYEEQGLGEGFVWVALNYEEYLAMGKPLALREYVADFFIQSVKNSRFGIVMVEEEPGKLAISFRGKEGSDMASYARKLGGGGHLLRAGATVYGHDFTAMVKEVLSSLR